MEMPLNNTIMHAMGVYVYSAAAHLAYFRVFDPCMAMILRLAYRRVMIYKLPPCLYNIHGTPPSHEKAFPPP